MLSEQRESAEFSILRYDEGVRLDPERLFALYAELGETAAESVLCGAMEEMAARMSVMRSHVPGSDPQMLIRSSSLLAKVADQVGMSMLARVARDVCACARTGDTNALAATIARLVRIGDRSLTAVWDLQDITI